MEILAVVAVALALYWAFSAKRSSQAALRYQLHKDSLAEAQRLVELYRRRDVPANRFYFNLDDVPLELQEFMASDLDELVRHVTTNQVPTELGNLERLRELSEAVMRVQAWIRNDFTSEARLRLRARAVDWTLGELRGLLSDARSQDMLVETRRALIEKWLKRSEAALTWGIAGEKIDLAEAKATVANARAAG